MDRGASGNRRLNHVEYAHRPGEVDLVVSLFEALGCPCRLVDTEPYGLYVVVDLDGSQHGINDMFVSQAEPEQLALEAALLDGVACDDILGESYRAMRRMMKQRPFRATHVGLRMPTVGELDTVIGRLEALASGPMAGRLELGTPFTRTHAESQATMAPMKQMWIWTDIFSTGLLALGQQIELQAYET
jgi:hypothetical protein